MIESQFSGLCKRTPFERLLAENGRGASAVERGAMEPHHEHDGARIELIPPQFMFPLPPQIGHL